MFSFKGGRKNEIRNIPGVGRFTYGIMIILLCNIVNITVPAENLVFLHFWEGNFYFILVTRLVTLYSLVAHVVSLRNSILIS